MCARPASELWAAGFRDVCRPWACACGDAHPMGQPGGACFSPPSHRTSRLRAEPTRTPHVLPCYHPCRTCFASPRPPRARLPATDGVGKAGVALGVECVCVYMCVCVRPCVRTYCVFIGVGFGAGFGGCGGCAAGAVGVACAARVACVACAACEAGVWRVPAGAAGAVGVACVAGAT